MLKLYYARPSIFARPAWLALLEKGLTFELVPVDLSGAQFKPEFMALNPFSHVPVLTDGEVRIVELLAILDYLEARYPTPALLPTDAIAVAKVRMVQSLTFNELLPAVAKLLIQGSHAKEDTVALEYARLRATKVLRFFEELLGDTPYFADEQLTLAEITAGTLVCRLPDIGIPLLDYPKLNAWNERLLARPTWQQIELSADEWALFKRAMQVMPKVWQQRRLRQVKAMA